MKPINFIFSSVTFLQQYIPLVIAAKSLNMTYRFFIRTNNKAYANPIIHKDKWNNLIVQYNITVLDIKLLNNYDGILIVIDGDIYGPGPKYHKTSCLNNINRLKFKPIISLTENFNFQDSYPIYKNWIDYIIVQNSHHINYYNFTPSQCLILGQPKFDITFDKLNILTKHNLNPTDKYVIIFYPRFDRAIAKFGNAFPDKLLQLYDWLHQLGYKILVKNREKLKLINKQFSGDKYFEDFYYYPNISMELLQISNLSIFFGSAVIEEIVMSKVPFIEFQLDNIDRFSFLRHPYYSYTITDNIFPTQQLINEKLHLITNPETQDIRNSTFNSQHSKYLFNPENICINILNTLQSI